MSIFKPNEEFSNHRPFDLIELLNKEADGVASDALFIDSPYTKIQLNAVAKNLADTHPFAKTGTPFQKEQYKTAHAAAINALVKMAIYAAYKCNGSAELLAKLCVPFYDASTKGRHSTEFSLEQGPNTGQLWISVPVESKHESYIAMYSLTEDAPLNECKLAGASTNCKFLLTGLPVTTRLFVRWAPVTSAGIGAWSISYPTAVS